MMEVVEGEAAARPGMAVDLGGTGGEEERQKLLATTTEDAKHNAHASHCDAPVPGEDPVVRSAGNHLEAAPTNGVATNR